MQPAVVENLADETTMDANGAVRSVQAADVLLSPEQADSLWSPRQLENLARTYWRFLTRITLGLIRVKYDEDGRYVCLLFRPLVLLSFQKPEYEMDQRRGIVRWRIKKGVLVSGQGRCGKGFLEIDVRRCGRVGPDDGRERLHVEVEVANFYPAIAHGISRWVYTHTQSRIHVIVTHGFLRSLRRLKLAESKVGRFASVDDVPDPVGRPTPTGLVEHDRRAPDPVG